jgi:hypothetical protein
MTCRLNRKLLIGYRPVTLLACLWVLKEDGIYEEVQARAFKRALAEQLDDAMQSENLAKQYSLAKKTRQRVHDFLRKKRRLSLEHVRALHEKLLMPAEVLIQAY